MGIAAGELVILSKPKTNKNQYEKHYVIRTLPANAPSGIIIGNALVAGSLQAITDTYDEAEQVIRNLEN